MNQALDTTGAATGHGASAIDDVDTNTIAWLLPEIVRAFDAATGALRQFRAGAAGVDRDHVDLALLRVARSHLHQAHGALELSEIAGVTRVTEAIEALLTAFEEDPSRCDATALDAIVGGCRTIVEYLEDLQGGAKQQPLFLFASYRDLLVLRGVDRIHPADLFRADLGIRVAGQAASQGTPLDATALSDRRRIFEQALLRYIRDENDTKAKTNLARAVTAIEASVAASATPAQAQQRAFWWVTRALFEALANDGFAKAPAHHPHIKRVAGRVNLQIRKLAEGSGAVAERLFADTLFFVAIAEPVTPLVGEVQERFRLVDAVPADFDTQRYGRIDGAAVKSARDALISAKAAWTSVVGGDVAQIQDFAKHTTDLVDAVGALRRPGLSRVAQVIDGIATDLGFDPRQPAGGVGLDVATALLFLEGALERARTLDDAFDQRADLVVARVEASATGNESAAAPVDWLDRMAREAEERLTIASFVGELQANLQSAEKELDAFFREPTQREGLADAQKALAQVSGALALLGHDDVHRAIDHARSVITGFQQGDVDPVAFDGLAQSLGAVGFYVEQIKRDRIDTSAFQFDRESGRLTVMPVRRAVADALNDAEPIPVVATAAPESALPATVTNIENLSYSRIAFAATQVLDSAETLEEEIVHRAADSLERALRLRATPDDRVLRDQLGAAVDDVRRNAALIDDRGLQDEAAGVLASLRRAGHDPMPPNLAAQIADAVTAMHAHALRAAGIAAPAAEPIVPVVAVPSEENHEAIDAELLEIFLEEAGDVLVDAQAALRVLDADPHNATATTTLRRGFHTLKGSSRMVGLMAFGEGAWAIEDALNRHIADQAPASNDLRALIEYAIRILSGWVDELRTSGHSSRTPDLLIEGARAMRAGEHPGTLAARLTTMPTVAEPVPQGVEPVIAESDGFAKTELLGDDEPAIDEPAHSEPMLDEPAIGEPVFARTEVFEEEPAALPDDEPPFAKTIVIEDAGPGTSKTFSLADEDPSYAKTELLGDAFDDDASSAETAPEEAALDAFEPLFDAAPPAVEPATLPSAPVEPEVEHAEPTGASVLDWLDTADEPASADSLADVSSPAIHPLDEVTSPSEHPFEESIHATVEPVEHEHAGPFETAAGFTADDIFGDHAAMDATADADATITEVEASEEAAPVALVEEPAPVVTGAEAAPVALVEEASPVAAIEEATPFTAADAAKPVAAAPSEDVRRIGPLVLSTALFNIYLSEADDLLRTLTVDFMEWRDELDRFVSEKAIRAAHSLAGSSATVGLVPAHDLAAAIEDVLLALYREPREMTDDYITCLSDATQALTRMLHRFAAERLPDAEPSHVEALRALRLEIIAGAHGEPPHPFAIEPSHPQETAEVVEAAPLPFEPLDFGDETASPDVHASTGEHDNVRHDTDEHPFAIAAVPEETQASLPAEPSHVDAAFDVEAAPAHDEAVASEPGIADDPWADRVPMDHVAEPVFAEPAPVAHESQVPTVEVEAEPISAAEFHADDVFSDEIEATPTHAPESADAPVAETRLQSSAFDELRPDRFVASQHVDVDHVGTEHVETEHVDAEHVDAQHVDAEHVDAEHVDARHGGDEPVDAAHVSAEHVSPEHDGAEHADAEHVDADPVEAEPSVTDGHDESDVVEPAFAADADVDHHATPSSDAPGSSLVFDAETEPAGIEESVASFDAVAPVEPAFAMPVDHDAHAAARRVLPSERESTVKDDIDPDLLGVFVEEGNEILPQIGALLRTWQANRSSDAPARMLLRHLHTLKGSARMAGAMRLGEVVHDIEARVESAARLHEVPAALIEELMAAHDRSLELFDQLQHPVAAAVQDATQATAEPVAAIDEASVESTSAETAVAESTTEAAQVAADAKAAPATATGRVRDAKTGAQQQVVRVPSETLDRLVNLAGEVSISRARIENEVHQIKSAMADLSDNTERLRAQLREIELQAEFQMQSRMQSQHTSGDALDELGEKFDPLEFDRFTRFQELTRMMAESVNDVKTVQQNLMKSLDVAETDLTSQRRLTRDLQQDLMAVRMVPFASIAERLFRVARRAAKEVDKRVNLDIRGGSVEIDRGVLERMAGPFEHLLRNHIVHGIETRDGRRSAGKNETGELLVEVRQEGNEIVILFSDDGAGLNYDRIRAKGRELGLIGDDGVSDAQAAELIFHPGFSTASEVTELAGRGVGMDVVRAEATELAGRVTVDSEAGKSTRFTINLPLTLAVTQVVLVSVASRVYALPAVLVEQVQQLRPQPLADAYRTGHIGWAGVDVRLAFLGTLLGIDESVPVAQRTSPVLVLRSAGERVAVHVDEVIGNQEVVVKNLGPQLARMTGIAGATVLGSGEIVLILNPVQLAHAIRPEPTAVPKAEGDSAEAATTGESAPAQPVVSNRTLKTLPTVMVVDDSLTVRRVTQRLLSREGYQVVLAKDGVDALEQLQDYPPDVMLVDIEMPRMDGFDLTRNVRNDERYRQIPIIMITSRTAEKHREHAMQLGVNAYLGKPYQEDELLELLATHVRARGAHPA